MEATATARSDEQARIRRARQRAKSIESTWPALSFHYGLSLDQLRSMPNVFMRMYVRQLGPLLARQQERAIEAASFAHMEEHSQREVRTGLREMIKTGEVELDDPESRGRGINPLVQVVSMGIGLDLPPEGSEPPREDAGTPSTGRWPGALPERGEG